MKRHIHPSELTKNDVVLLPSMDRSLAAPLPPPLPVDLSSIVEGMDEDGDGEEDGHLSAFPLHASHGPWMPSGIGIGSSGSSGLGSPLPRRNANDMNHPHNDMNHHDNHHTPSPSPSNHHNTNTNTYSDIEKDFLTKIDDLFASHDLPLPHTPTNHHLHHSQHSQTPIQPTPLDSDLHSSLINIMPDPLPTLRLASDGHPGNNRFYVLIRLHRKEFQHGIRTNNHQLCDQVATKIIKFINCGVPKGRFLEAGSDGYGRTVYRELSIDDGGCGGGGQVVELVKWALREPPKVEIACYLEKACIVSDPETERERETNNNHSGNSTPNANSANNANSPYPKSFVPSPQNELSSDSLYETYRNPIDSHSETNSLSSHHDSISSRSSSNFSFSSSMLRRERRSRDSKRESTTSLKRRGTISSIGGGGKNARKRINLADRRFTVGEPLSKLVERVFATTLPTNSTYLSESGGSDSKRTERNERGHKSDVRRLNDDMSSFRIEPPSDHGPTNGNHSPGNTTSPHTTTTRNPPDVQTSNHNVQRNPESPPILKVKTKDGHITNLNEYDVLITTHSPDNHHNHQNNIKLHPSNHIGNNRFRTMLQMYKRKFHSPSSTPSDQRYVSSLIVQHVTQSKKGMGRFLSHTPHYWMEMDHKDSLESVRYFLNKCQYDPELSLPSLKQSMSRSWRIGSAGSGGMGGGEKGGKFGQLHDAALESLRKKSKKKILHGMDARQIEQIQSQMCNIQK